jgi:hypothetical protein
VALAVDEHLGVHPVGRAAQGQFAQGAEVPGPEEVPGGPFGLPAQVDLALLEPLPQVLGRQIHQDDRLGPFQHRVGHGLPDPDAGDLGHHVV